MCTFVNTDAHSNTYKHIMYVNANTFMYYLCVYLTLLSYFLQGLPGERGPKGESGSPGYNITTAAKVSQTWSSLKRSQEFIKGFLENKKVLNKPRSILIIIGMSLHRRYTKKKLNLRIVIHRSWNWRREVLRKKFSKDREKVI